MSLAQLFHGVPDHLTAFLVASGKVSREPHLFPRLSSSVGKSAGFSRRPVVRARSEETLREALATLLSTGMASVVSQCQWSRYRLAEVGECGRALMGHAKRSTLNYAVYPEFPDRMVEVRTCVTSIA